MCDEAQRRGRVVDDSGDAGYHAGHVRTVSRVFTILTVLAIVAGLVWLVRGQIETVSVGENLRTYVLLRDGSRIAPGSPVVIAGVRVGDITGVSLEGGLARIDLRLRDDIRVPQTSMATRRADKLFGDSYIEIIPDSSPDAPILQPGQRLLHAIEGSSSDAILRGIDRALPKGEHAMEQTKEAAQGARAWISGPFAEGLARSQAWLDEGKIQQPIARLDSAVATIDDMTERAELALDGADVEVLGTLDRIDRAVRDARAQIRTANESVVGVAEATEEGLSRMDPVVRDLTEVLQRVNEPGQDEEPGTLSRLINDGELADDMENAAQSGAEFLRDATSMKVLLGMRGEYNFFTRAQRFFVTAEIRPRPGFFYYFEIERGPQGGPFEPTLEASGDSYIRKVDLDAGSRYTAQFGKQLGPLSLRGGIKSSTFGAGVDLSLAGRLKLSADLSGGSFSNQPNLKLSAALAVFRSVYLLAGIDNALTTPGYLPISSATPEVPMVLDRLRYGRDYFLGANLVFTEQDLAMLLRVYGALLVGLL
jgi:phospholipid/cholesterol/gamma-HCH transport system substrate-binding protein